MCIYIYIYSIIQYIYLCIQYICNLMAPSHVVGDSNNYRNFNAIVCYNITVKTENPPHSFQGHYFRYLTLENI